MLSRLRTRREAGDTIVEVMVVLAVLGLAIGLAYGTASRSLLATRAAQENAQATAWLQGQIEQLRTRASITDPHDANYIYLPNQPNNQLFCMSGGDTVPDSSDPTQHQKYVTDCTNQQGLYDISIAYTPPVSPQQTRLFTLTAVWPDVQGQGQDTVTLLYRIYPSSL